MTAGEHPGAEVSRRLLAEHNGHGDAALMRGVLVSLGAVEPEQVRWLWPGRLPAGKLAVLDGDPSLGKSTLAVAFAAYVSTGTLWPDGAGCPAGQVVILSAEDGMADTIRPRLDAAGGDPSRVHCLTAMRDVDPEDGSVYTRPPTLADVAAIREVIERTGALLLIVDVLMAYLPGKVDSHRDQDVRAVLHRLAELADATGCAVLLVRHLNKAGAGSPMYRGGGSIGIIGAARAGYVVARDPDDQTGATRVLACVKNNLAPEPPSLAYRLEPVPGSHVARVRWVGVSEHQAADLLNVPGTEDERSERDEAVEWLLAYLADEGGSAPAAAVLKAAGRDGIAKTTLHRARKRAGVTTEKGGMTRGWTWRHPADLTPARPEDSAEGSEGPSSQDPEPSEPSRNLPGGRPQPGQSGQPPEPDPTGTTVAQQDNHRSGSETA